MLKKVWFMFVLWSVLMVSGCSGGMSKQNEGSESVWEIEVSESDVCVEADIDVIGSSDTSMETEQTEISKPEERSGNASNSEASTTEKPTVDDTTKEVDAEPSTTEAPGELETATTQPITSSVEIQPITPEQTTPVSSTEVPAKEDGTQPDTDDRDNPADGSPVLEITFNIP